MYFKVIKSGTNQKLAVSHTVFEKFDVKQSNDLEICPRPLTVVSPESCHVAMYVKCSEDSDRMNQKSPFSSTPLSFDAPSPANLREYLHKHKPYNARNYVPWATFLSLSVYGYRAALQIFEQFCPKAGDANPLVAEPERDFNAKWSFKVIQGHLFRYH